MKRRTPTESAAQGRDLLSGWTTALAAGLIVLATVSAFSNSLGGPFIFDDGASIAQNPTIRQLWPIWKPLCPISGETVSGRPLLNLSLAINYAISGDDVRSYHATNLLIHVLVALLLFGVVRRTFLLPAMRDRWGGAAVPLAVVIAVLWAIHPLQTESVTYVVQRGESLVALFYFLTLYCFIRGANSAAEGEIGWDGSCTAVPTRNWAGATFWYIASALACLLGMACKEVMVSAPLIVLLYDRTFCAGSFREAWRQRRGLYVALGCTWLLQAGMVFSAGNRGGSAGFAVHRFTWWSYLFTQPGVVVHYLRLVFWPSGLCLDYGWPAARTLRDVLVPALPLLGLLGLTVWALVKRPAWGLLGVWFFAILAPTSSVVPIRDAAFEHRMYMPLAALMTGLVIGGFLIGRQLARRGVVPLPALQVLGVSLAVLLAIALEIVTLDRNLDYQNDISIWRDTAAKAPRNERAHYNLGLALANGGDDDGAILEYQKAVDLRDDLVEAHNNLGNLLAHRGQFDEAIPHLRRAAELRPDNQLAYNNLGLALAGSSRLDEAIAQYEKALKIKPDFAEAHNNLGLALAESGRTDEAITHYRKAMEIKPGYAQAHHNLGVALAGRGQTEEAIAQYRQALAIQPDYADAYSDLGLALMGQGRWDEAIAQCRKAVEIEPDYAEALDGLATVYAKAGRFSEAAQTARQALKIATQQGNRQLSEAIKAKIPLYEGGTSTRP